MERNLWMALKSQVQPSDPYLGLHSILQICGSSLGSTGFVYIGIWSVVCQHQIWTNSDVSDFNATHHIFLDDSFF